MTLKNILFLLFPIITFGQVNFPTVPQPTQFQNYGTPNFGGQNNRNQTPNPINQILGDEQQRTQQQNQQIINETQKRENQREQQMREVYKDINKSKSNINYNLPSNESKVGTQYYKSAFEKMLILDETNYSLKDVNFQIENAFFDDKMNKTEFDKTIKQTGDFLIAKMKELNYDLNSNSAKKLYDFSILFRNLTTQRI